MKGPAQVHHDAMLHIMKYCVETCNQGLVLEPNTKWAGSRDFEFTLSGRSDSDYAKCETTRKSVLGYCAPLNSAPIVFKSVTQKRCAQTRTGIGRIESTLADDFGDGQQRSSRSLQWLEQGRANVSHWDKSCLLHKLKEGGLLLIKHIPGEMNGADLFTKNLDGPLFCTFAEVYVSHTKYM
jgi:hypothetical protein